MPELIVKEDGFYLFPPPHPVVPILHGRAVEEDEGIGKFPDLGQFVYGGKVTPTFPVDPRKERRSYWWIKKTGLPHMYWDYMLKGHEWFFKHDTEYDAGG